MNKYARSVDYVASMARSLLRGYRHFPAVHLVKHTSVVALIFVGVVSTASAHLNFSDSISSGLVNSVPDGGMTAILLGGALAVLAVLRRLVKR